MLDLMKFLCGMIVVFLVFLALCYAGFLVVYWVLKLLKCIWAIL